MTKPTPSSLHAMVTAFLSQEGLSREGRPCPEFGDEDNLFELGYLDSSSFFDLVFVLEERLGCRINFLEADPADLVSVAGLARYLAAGEVFSSSGTDGPPEKP